MLIILHVFVIKDEKNFNKYMTNQEKVSNVVKNLIGNLYIIRNI